MNILYFAWVSFGYLRCWNDVGDLDLFLRIVPKPSHVQFATNPCFELWIIPLTNEILNILPVGLPPGPVRPAGDLELHRGLVQVLLDKA